MHPLTRSLSLLVLLSAGLSGCANPYDVAYKANTIEAYETFLAENPTSPRRTEALNHLEELILEKARTENTVEAYDAYLARFPEGNLHKEAQKEYLGVVFAAADQQDTAEAWQKALDACPAGDKKRRTEARQRLNMAQNAGIVTVGPVSLEQVNLAENPDGPLDGWGIYADVSLAGDKQVETLNMQVSYLGGGGEVLDTSVWPVVAKYTPDRSPIEEEFKIPMKPGETRTFSFTTGDTPVGWAKKVTVKPVHIKFLDEAEHKEE